MIDWLNERYAVQLSACKIWLLFSCNYRRIARTVTTAGMLLCACKMDNFTTHRAVDDFRIPVGLLVQ